MYYFNSKNFKTILIKRKDVASLGEYLLKKLETVVDLWENDESCESFPFNRPQLFIGP